MEKKENTQFIDKIVKALRKSANEMEDFKVDADKGIAEAKDKYEEIKKKFNLFLQDSESKIKAGKEQIDDINTKFDELRVQLALGKAETVELFIKQKKQLLLTLHELEVKIKTNETLNRMYAFVLIEIEKFKVQLEVLEQKFDPVKEETKISFVKGKQEFSQFIDRLKVKYSKKKEETKWVHFQSEISEAFTHFKHAFTES